MLTLTHPSLQIVRGFAGAMLFSFPITIALWISFYILWTFGRTDGLTFAQLLLKEMIVLGFPAALGAGAARLLF
jgi:uncharacterized membrane protein